MEFKSLAEIISFHLLLLSCLTKSTLKSSSTSVAADKEACGTRGVCYCDDIPGFAVFCEELNLRDVPTDIPTNTSFLDLNYNEIESIPENGLWGLYNLTDLQLVGNNLATLPKNVFRDLHALIYLSIDDNKLKVLPDGLLDNTPFLTKLSLNRNNIELIPENLFNSTTLLRTFSIGVNNVTKLPSNLFSKTPVFHHLGIARNKLNEIPTRIFDKTPRLQYIDAEDNVIRKVPADLLAYTLDLKRIDLSGNDLLHQPDGFFSSTPFLETIVLSSNLIPSVTNRTFFGVKRVYRLFISRNRICNLPRDLFRGVHVDTMLDLSNNVIEDIPPGIFNMNERPQELRWLYLHGNSLTYLAEDSFAGLSNVSVITLSSNKLHTIKQRVFIGHQLDQIFLFGNNLTTIEGNSFKSPSISEIHLYGNDLEIISEQFLLGLRNSTLIYLKCDSLKRLPRDAIHQLITCVSPMSIPTIDISRYDELIRESFMKGGFQCRNDKCRPCLPGTYGNRKTSGCQTCPIGGFYQDEIGKTAFTPGGMSCKECNVGTYVKNGHGTSIRDCEVCPEGTNQSLHAGFRACFCKEGYARTDRYGPCSICLDEGLDCSKDFKLLAGGYFWYWKFPTANISRYGRFIENLNNENGNISQYTNYTGDTPKTFRCPRKESCPNGNGDVEGQCGEGYTGWLCSKCLQGYYSVLNTCIKCPSKETLIIEVVSFISICILICFLFSWQLKRDARRDRLSRSFLDVVISRVKILLGFYQVVGEIFASVHDISWKGPLVIIGAFISSLELNILRIFVRPRCMSERLVINPKIEFIIGVSCPIVIIVIPLCVYQARKLFLRCKSFYYHATLPCKPQLKNLRTRLVTCVIVLLFLFYPPICSVIFELYPRACKTFSLDKDKIYNVTRLRSDYDFNCDDLSFYQTCAYIFTGVYVVMFPAILLFMLRSYVPRQSKSSDRPEQVNSSDDNANQDDELTPLVVNDWKDKSPPVPLWLNFLCENYKQKYWFWEIIELCRKVTQTLLITLYGWEDRLTVLLTTCISVLFLLLHARYRPMKELYEQRLQMLSLTVIFINVLVAANDEPKDEYEDSISVILILLNILVLVIIVGEVLMTIVLHVKHSELFGKFVTLLRRFTLKLQQKR